MVELARTVLKVSLNPDGPINSEFFYTISDSVEKLLFGVSVLYGYYFALASGADFVIFYRGVDFFVREKVCPLSRKSDLVCFISTLKSYSS